MWRHVGGEQVKICQGSPGTSVTLSSAGSEIKYFTIKQSYLCFHFLKFSTVPFVCFCFCQCISVSIISFFLPIFLPLRANACIAGPRCHRYPVQAVVPAVGEFGVQPDTLPHLLSVPVLPLHHGGRRRRPQHHRTRVPGSGTQRLTLHAA